MRIQEFYFICSLVSFNRLSRSFARFASWALGISVRAFVEIKMKLNEVFGETEEEGGIKSSATAGNTFVSLLITGGIADLICVIPAEQHGDARCY